MTEDVRDLPELDGIQHRFLDLPGMRMHAAETGSGEAVVLLHGFPQHWWAWRGVIPRLAKRYRVIVPDLRGAGWSGAPPNGYTPEQLLEDVVQVLDALQLERVRIVAHDWSAIVAFTLALTRPDRVQALVAIGVPHPWVRFSPAMIPLLPGLWFQTAISAPGLGARLLGRGRQRLTRYLFSHFAVRPDVWSEADLETFLAPMREPGRARAGSLLYRQMISPSFRAIMAGRFRSMRLTVPTLIAYGAQDAAMQPAMLAGYEPYADDLELLSIPDGGHFVVDEQPEAVADAVSDFFARQSR